MFAATIQPDGTFRPDHGNAIRGRLAQPPWRGKHVTVSVSRFVRNKTNPQLNTFHGPVLDGWCEYTGYDKREMKRELKLAYLVPQLVISRLTGEEIRELPSLADLSVEEMSEFLDTCLREGRQQGIVFAIDESSAGI